MTDEDKLPVPDRKTEITTSREGRSKALARIAGDALVTANALISPTLHRVGGYQFRAEDYRQICLWARAMDLSAEDVVERLDAASVDDLREGFPAITFEVESGSIVSLPWNFDALPLPPASFEWVEGLQIRRAAFFSANRLPANGPMHLSIRLPWLEDLAVASFDLDALHLSGVPKLRRLICRETAISAIDVSGLPELDALCCDKNRLEQLVLTDALQLRELSCRSNRLTALILPAASELTYLDSSDNLLTELNVADAEELESLTCSNNMLSRITFSNPALFHLDCSRNRLTEIDTTSLARLTDLWCSDNEIESLDIQELQMLRTLNCRNNPITHLEVRNMSSLCACFCDIGVGGLIPSMFVRNLQHLRGELLADGTRHEGDSQ